MAEYDVTNNTVFPNDLVLPNSTADQWQNIEKILDGAKYPGVDLLGCTGTVIVDNNFAAGPSGTPGNGQTWPTPPPTNILEVECAETVRKNNTGTAVNT